MFVLRYLGCSKANDFVLLPKKTTVHSPKPYNHYRICSICMSGSHQKLGGKECTLLSCNKSVRKSKVHSHSGSIETHKNIVFCYES